MQSIRLTVCLFVCLFVCPRVQEIVNINELQIDSVHTDAIFFYRDSRTFQRNLEDAVPMAQKYLAFMPHQICLNLPHLYSSLH